MKTKYRSGHYNGTKFIINNQHMFLMKDGSNQIYMISDATKILKFFPYSKVESWTKLDIVLFLLIPIFFIMFLLQIAMLDGNWEQCCYNRILILTYVIVNVILHESGHAIVIKLFTGYLPKIKIK